MECSPQARAWAVKYLKENNTEAFENLVDIFGEIIYNDPMVQRFTNKEANNWYTIFKMSQNIL